MSASDFVRRAAAGVTSTLAQASSTVTSVAQGRKTYDVNSEVLEKFTMTIKCSPKKDAMTTTSLAIKSGYLMKRNEQGQWQRRYICTVPHLFLYYYDSDSAAEPRGIIDMELYNNISRYKNSLKVAPANEDKMRSFHFQGDDSDSLNDWLTHFMRDRYFAVCEERNAYQQMQSELTAVLDTIASQTKAVEIDKDIVEKHLEEAIVAKEEAVSMLRSMLVIMGITEEEMSKLHDLNRIGHCLEEGILSLKKEVETKFFGPDEALEAEKLAHQQDVAALKEQVEMEIRARKNLEAMLLKQKKASELQAADWGNQVDTLNLNFQLIVASKVEIEEKNASLAEQRRLLIKEVKRTRGKLTGTENSLEQVEGVNLKLTTAVSALQAQLTAAQTEIAALKKAAAVSEQQAEAREKAAVTAAVMAALDALASAGGAPQQQVAANSAESETIPPAPVNLDVDAIPIQMASISEDTNNDTGTTTGSTQDSSAPEPTQTTAPAEAAPAPSFSADQLQSILAESQAIMSSLRPLSTSHRSTGSRTGSGSGTATPHGTLSNSNSGANLVSSTHSDSGSSAVNGASGGANEPPSPLNLKELGWLSPEQEKLVDSRLQLHQQQHPEVEAKYTYLSTSNTTGASEANGGIGDGGDNLAHAGETAESSADATTSSKSVNNNSSAYDTAASTASSTISMFSGAMSLLSSTASATINSASGAPNPSAEESATSSSSSAGSGKRPPPRGIISSIFQAEKASPNGVASSATGADTEQEDPERLPSAMRLNCLRCAGTVEGPKYSTCKCSVPALVPEDLNTTSSGSSSDTAGGGSAGKSSSWGFSGMFSKSSSVFKEGLAKASQVTASNVESLMKAAASASSSSGSGSATSAGTSTGGGATADGALNGEKVPVKKEGYSYYNKVVSAPSPAVPVPVASPAVECQPPTATGAGASASEAQPSPTATVLPSSPAPTADVAAAGAVNKPEQQERADHENKLWDYILGENATKGTTGTAEELSVDTSVDGGASETVDSARGSESVADEVVEDKQAEESPAAAVVVAAVAATHEDGESAAGIESTSSASVSGVAVKDEEILSAAV